MLLHPAPFSTEKFNYDAATNTFSADMSDLGHDPARVSSPRFPLSRIWDDAMDLGMILRSHKTGREIYFAVEHEEHDREGELLFIELRPIREGEWGAGTVKLWND